MKSTTARSAILNLDWVSHVIIAGDAVAVLVKNALPIKSSYPKKTAISTAFVTTATQNSRITS